MPTMGAISRTLKALEGRIQRRRGPDECRCIWADDADVGGPVDEAALLREVKRAALEGRRLRYIVIRDGEARRYQ